MLAKRAWFSASRLPDRRHHRIYNEYHQLDHRPENLALPGVVFGERWVCPPELQAACSYGDPRFEGMQYLVHYLLGDPLGPSTQEWLDLSRTAFQEGRRPETGLVERPFMGWFRPLKTYVNPRVRISAEALPWRPVQGVFVNFVEIDPGADKKAVHDELARLEEERMPAAIGELDVAGVAVYVSDPDAESPFSTSLKDESFATDPDLRVELYFLDADPLQASAALRDLVATPDPDRSGADGAPILRPLFAGPLAPIGPWQWSWFDGEAQDDR